MSRRDPQKTMNSLPRDHLAWRVAIYLHENPHEVLTRGDIAAKFDTDTSMVDTLMGPAVAANYVKIERGTEDGVVWRRPKRVRTAFPVPFTPSLSAHSRRAQRTTPRLIDLSRISIDHDVPLPGPTKPRSVQWAELFGRMGVGDSFVVPAQIHNTLCHARQQFQRQARGSRFTVRKVSASESRCWRVA